MLPEHATLERMPARLGWWPVPLSQRAMIAEGRVAGHEAGDQEHRLAAAVGHAPAAEDGVSRESRQLESHSGFAP